MFERTLIGPGTYARKPYTFVVSTAGQVLLILLLVVVPLLSTESIPGVLLRSLLQAPTIPPAAPRVAEPADRTRATPAERVVETRPFTQPREIPREIAVIKEDPSPVFVEQTGPGVVGIPPELFAGRATRAVLEVVERHRPPPAVQVKVEPKPVTKVPVRVTVGGKVLPPELLRQVPPVYPNLAKIARISGVVKLTAVIGVDGQVKGVRLVSGHHLLAPAAAAAVQQWLYRPTLLNGEPVEVILAVDVNFRLGR